jgi:hypothetical protein
MREMKMLRWCDMCWHEGQLQQEATWTYTIGLVANESRPALKLLEVCDTHNKVVVDLAAMLAEVGQLPDLPKKVGRPPLEDQHPRRTATPCPVCRVEVAKNTMVAHIWTNHRTDEKPPLPEICPQCRAHIPSPQGMAQHKRVQHGFDAVADALSGVKGFKQ